jgi:hypothetical protein
MLTKFMQIIFLRNTIYTNIKITKFIHDYYCFLFILFYCMVLYKGRSLNCPWNLEVLVFQLHCQEVGGVETNCSTNNCLGNYNCTTTSLVGPEPNVWSFIQFWLTRKVTREECMSTTLLATRSHIVWSQDSPITLLLCSLLAFLESACETLFRYNICSSWAKTVAH